MATATPRTRSATSDGATSPETPPINQAEAFFGYYPVQEHTVKLDNEPTAMWDLMGKDATLFHHSADNDPDSMASQYIAQSAMWFDSIWASIAREPAR